MLDIHLMILLDKHIYSINIYVYVITFKQPHHMSSRTILLANLFCTIQILHGLDLVIYDSLT